MTARVRNTLLDRRKPLIRFPSRYQLNIEHLAIIRSVI
jgi:hypothetical protein